MPKRTVRQRSGSPLNERELVARHLESEGRHAEAAEVRKGAKKPNKYHAVAVCEHGQPWGKRELHKCEARQRFDSTREWERWCQLFRQQAQGKIAELRTQPEYPLVVNGVKVATYRADFAYIHVRASGKCTPVVEDVKGVKTAVYVMKKKLMLALHGITIVET